MNRVVIIGWPGTGKSTLAASMGNHRSTDDVMHLGWSEASAEVSKWFDSPGPWVIEGVAVPRALRKWREANPNLPPPVDRVIYLDKRYKELSQGQQAMGKGVDIVLKELDSWLSEAGPGEQVFDQIREDVKAQHAPAPNIDERFNRI